MCTEYIKVLICTALLKKTSKQKHNHQHILASEIPGTPDLYKGYEDLRGGGV